MNRIQKRYWNFLDTLNPQETIALLLDKEKREFNSSTLLIHVVQINSIMQMWHNPLPCITYSKGVNNTAYTTLKLARRKDLTATSEK
ncbi:MAG: hypothetical protein IKY37_07120 [Bacteroidaceae bacterium]|nr:hypothetical protein [Bacteroidaceae bacterium]